MIRAKKSPSGKTLVVGTKSRRRKKGVSFARLTPWDRGQVVAYRNLGVRYKEIRRKISKTDGKHPTVRACEQVYAKAKKNPSWKGEDSKAGGRPDSLKEKEKKKVVKLVEKERGRFVVTTKFCKKRLPFLRKVCDNTIRNALHDAGLAWLRRRVKRVVPKVGNPKVIYNAWKP